jgi:hypothetical protein
MFLEVTESVQYVTRYAWSITATKSVQDQTANEGVLMQVALGRLVSLNERHSTGLPMCATHMRR